MKTVLDYNVLSKFNFLKMIFVLIGDNCQYWMDLENQRLSSPYYPQNYFPDGIGCEWLITAPEGHVISLEFDDFNVSKNGYHQYERLSGEIHSPLIFYLFLKFNSNQI